MFRRRKKSKNPSGQPNQQSPSSAPAASPGSVPSANTTTVRKVQPIPAVLKESIEKTAELAKNELISHGKIKSMALFVYLDHSVASEAAASTIKKAIAVSLAWQSDLQKEAVRKRVKEKVTAEKVDVVAVLLNDRDKAGQNSRTNNAPRLSGTVIITTSTSHNRASASLRYVFEKETKVVSTWDLAWHKEPAQNFFLEGIFDTP